MKHLFTFLAFTIYAISIQAQTPEDSVKAAVNKLFVAMKTSDGVLLKNAFADSAILQTITKDKDGKTMVQTDKVDDFVKTINAVAKGDVDERIVFDVVKIDGPLAIAWTPYKLYYKGNFMHCGVNSFQLVKIAGNWKIQYLIDTRQKNGCPLP
jgi:hypothetical protein